MTIKKNNDWNGKVADVWTNLVPPGIPAISEINIYLKHIRKIQYSLNRRLKMLILGSTPEFRDLGYEQNFDVTVVDSSKDYYQNISKAIRHKALIDNEKVNFMRWEDINHSNEFDVVIGDLALCLIPLSELEDFVKRISKALKQNGLFLGKSLFIAASYKAEDPQRLVEKYYEGPPIHPYPALLYDLAVYCLNENNCFDYRKMYNVLKELNKEQILKDEAFDFFEKLGWNIDIDIEVQVLSLEIFEELVSKYFSIANIEYGDEVYSKYFPLYILVNK